MKRTTVQWANILKKCGVKAPQVVVWAPLFAEVVQDTAFSLGDKEIDIFLGQILHESGLLMNMQENLNYSAARIIELGNKSPVGSRWRSLVPKATQLARNPQAFANAVYGGRLGNTEPNDGWDFRGSGPIQVTGKSNFWFLQKITGIPLLANPDLLRTPTKEALKVCIAWWEGNVPDTVMMNPRKVRVEVNGGDFGLTETIRIAGLAKTAMMA